MKSDSSSVFVRENSINLDCASNFSIFDLEDFLKYEATLVQ